MKIKPTPEQVEAVRYAGALGHTHFTLARGVDGKLYVRAETCSLADALRPTYEGEPASARVCVIARVGKKRYLRRVA